MGVKNNYGAAAYAVEALSAFQSAATTKYQAAYVRLGKGVHTFGHMHFHTTHELADEITTALTGKLSDKKVSGKVDTTCALFSFQSKNAFYAFMSAVGERHVPLNNFVVQIAGKSREWHQKAGEYLAAANRNNLKENPEAERATHSNVPTYAGTLVDYNFPDLGMMRGFCAEMAAGTFDSGEAALKAATQPQLSLAGIRSRTPQ